MLIDIPAGHAVALASHHWIEVHPSLISVNAMLGARADVYMCWLGLTECLLEEYRRQGLVVLPSLSSPRDAART